MLLKVFLFLLYHVIVSHKHYGILNTMASIIVPKLPSLKTGSRTAKGKSYFYLQTYTFHYDKTLKRSIRDSQKTVGKIKGQEQFGEIEWYEDFLNQYPELRKIRSFKTKNGIEFKPLEEEIPDRLVAERPIQKKLAGAYWAISKAMAQTGIGNALKQVFGDYHRDLKLASVVMYMLIKRNGGIMHHYPPFSKLHYLPWPSELNDHQLGTLFSHVTYDRLIKFFNALGREYYKHHEELFKRKQPQRLILALDSTSISTYSKELPNSEWGHNKDGDCLKQINYLLLCDELTGMPVYGKMYKGNVVDSSTVKNLISDLSIIFEKAEVKPELIFTTDRGYESTDNMETFLRNGHKFIIRSKISTKWVQDIVDSVRNKFTDENLHDEFTKQYMITTEVTYKYDPFPITGKRKNNSESVKLYAHVYFDEEVFFRRRENLRFNINNARTIYNAKIKKIHEEYEKTDGKKSKTANGATLAEKIASVNIGKIQSFIDNYCYLDSEGYALIDLDKFKSRIKNAGVMVILSNVAETASSAYAAYFRRMTVERNFQNFKSALDFDRPRASTQSSLQGRFLCEFIASAIYVLFQNRIASYEKTPEAKEDHIILSNMSLPRIIEELNTVMLTSYKNGGYFDEICGKYRTLYKALQIPLPESFIEGIKDFDVDEEETSEYEEPDLQIKEEEL